MGRGFYIMVHLFLVRRGICVQSFMTLAQTEPEICTFKVFLLVAIASTMGALGSNPIAFFLVPPYSSLQSFMTLAQTGPEICTFKVFNWSL